MAQDNLAHFTADGKQPGDPLLRELLQLTCAGEGVLQRLSPRRTVLRLQHDGRSWLLKLDAPDRPFESLRALLRRPSMLREARNWKLLAQRWADLGPVADLAIAEQLDPSRGCFARPWVEGLAGVDWRPTDMQAVGAGLAKLHAHGWTDPDLAPGDLLLDAQRRLLPLDLGHAKIGSSPTLGGSRHQDLLQLLGGLPPDLALELASDLLDAYRAASEDIALAELTADILLVQATQWRADILQRQSRRCLRHTRDFTPTDGGIRRTEGVGSGTEETTIGHGADLGRETFRALYEQELLGVPGLRPMTLEIADDGSWIITGRKS